MSQKKHINVCMLIDAWYPFIGGGQVHVKNLIKALENNHPVSITLFHSPHHHLLIRTLWCFWVIPQILFSHLKKPFNLIHAHAYAPGLPGKIASVLLNIPIVFTVHGSNLMDTKEKSLKAWLEKILLTKIHYHHQITVSSSFTKYLNVNQHLSVIGNGVNLKLFNQIKAKKYSKFTFLYVGRNHPKKGIEYLKRAFNKLKQKNPHINLKLIFSGKISGTRLIKAYKKAHALVLPSLVEGQPLVILEAWAARIPIIATQIPGITEIATSGKNAILVKPASINSLKQGMDKLIFMSSAEKNKLINSGYSQVKQFSWEKIASQTFKIYQSL